MSRLYAEGSCPSEQLYGVAYLTDLGHEIAITPWQRDVFGEPLGSIERRIPRRVRELTGPVTYQRAVTNTSKASDVLYSAQADCTQGIGLLKSIGLFRTPIIGFVHPKYNHSRWSSLSVRSMDRVLCHSAHQANRIHQLADVPSNKIEILHWGPDLHFSGYRVAFGGEGVISSGKARRDLPTLLSAAATLPSVRFTIYGNPPPSLIGPNITRGTRSGFLSVLEEVSASAVVAISIPSDGGETTGTTGLTELNVAFALGKPVVMTRNPFIDVDIDAEGIGIAVDARDPVGWARAIQVLIDDPVGAMEMGARGRKFVEESWNADNFNQHVGAILEVFE